MAVPNTLLLDHWCKQHIKGYAGYDVDDPNKPRLLFVRVIDPESGRPRNFTPVEIGQGLTDRIHRIAYHAGLWIESANS